MENYSFAIEMDPPVYNMLLYTYRDHATASTIAAHPSK